VGVREETLSLFRQGFTPRQISDKRGVSIRTTLPYLDELVGRGVIRRSDIYFSVDSETRRAITTEFQDFGKSIRDFIEALRRRREHGKADDAEVVLYYADARTAFGDMYQDLRTVEVTLHSLIKATLNTNAGRQDWWAKFVTAEVRKECERRRSSDQKPAEHAYAYTDLLHLRRIVKDNWSIVAAALPERARNKELFLSDLQQLNRIRRAVMHPVRGAAPVEEDFDFVRGLKRRLDF
jgi:hypothetical protein